MNLKHLLKELRYYTLLEGSPKRVVYKYIFTKTPLTKLVNSKIYNYFYKKRVKKFTRKPNPKVLQIENSNFCNARCIMCPHTSMLRKKSVMGLMEFKKIVRGVMAEYKNIEIITITGFGEPTTDSGLIEKIRYINKEYPKIKIDLFTNGGLLTKKLSDGLLQTNLRRINFSINSLEKKYKAITGLDYKIVKNNILYFVKRKKKLNKKFPLVNFSLMIIKENQKDIEDFIKFWSNYGDSVMTYLPLEWTGKKKIEQVEKPLFKKKMWACQPLWRNITFDVEGNLIMCCQDYESKVKFGNALKSPVKEIYESKKYNQIREKHKKNNFSMELCKECDNAINSSLWWWDY